MKINFLLIISNQLETEFFPIDDISGFFFSNERGEPFEDISSFETNYIFNKVFTFLRDNIYTDERQFSIVNVLQEGIAGYINEYATLSTYPPLGFYDYLRSGDGWDLTFNPVKFEYNAYDVSSVSISLLDGVTGTGTTELGDIVDFTSSQETIPGVETTIASFPVQIGAA